MFPVSQWGLLPWDMEMSQMYYTHIYVPTEPFAIWKPKKNPHFCVSEQHKTSLTLVKGFKIVQSSVRVDQLAEESIAARTPGISTRRDNFRILKYVIWRILSSLQMLCG